MRRLFLCAPLAAVLLVSGEVSAQRLGSRDVGGSDIRGRLASRGAPTPSFSPPNRPNVSRPNRTPTTRPSLIPESRPSRPGGGGNRPTLPNRPNIGGGDRPNRPSLPERPNIGGGGRPPINIGGDRPNRPNLPERPGIGGGNRPPIIGDGNRPNRPTLPERPGIGGGNRPPIIGDGNRPNRPTLPERPGIGGRPPIIGDGNGIINRPNRPINRPIRPPDRPIFINNRPININTIRPGSRPWYDYHYHPWHRGYWGWWRPAGWFLGGAAAGWMLAPGQPTYVFSNPFYDQSTTVFNYSLPLPPPPADPVSDVQSIDTAESAIEIFDRAREAFKTGAFQQALALVDQAIQELPTDATLHEFRALCLFALKDYKQAAATLYAVLAAGPGWDWETMNSHYPDVATYTQQLRALEAFQKANPNSADASFVLAYHYLVLGHLEPAVKQLENVVRILPTSQMSAQLLASLQAEVHRPAPPPGSER
jgi:hypothetical protein